MKKEIIKLQVRVEIKYQNKEYKKAAIESAKEMVLGSMIGGSLYRVKPLTSKLIKKATT